MTKKRTKAQTLQLRLQALGCEFAGPDHPIYSSGTPILFGNRIAQPPKPVEDAPTRRD